MYLNVDAYIEFIGENQLSQSQYLLMYCLYRKRFDLIKNYKEYFPSGDGTMIGKEQIEGLIQRGFIKKVGDGEKGSDYELTEKFTKQFLKNHYTAAGELWDLYPGFANINGKNIPLVNMDKYQFANVYGERIFFSIEEHQEVIKDVQFGRARNLICSSIENFVHSEQWQKLRKLRKAAEVEVVPDPNNTNVLF